jgi:cobalt-zinc-cadmium efflux system outer membrane protein
MLSTFRLPRLPRVAFALLATVAIGPAARAEEPATLQLGDAVSAALAHNPDLRVFEFDLRAADARGAQAALRPAPVLAAGLEKFGGTGEAGSVRTAEGTLSLSQVIELGGKRDSRIAVAGAARESVKAARQAAQLDLLAEVARRFIAVISLQEQLRIDLRAAELGERTLQAAETRVKAARAPHVEFDRATIALERSRLDQRATLGRLDAARRSLAALWASDDATLEGRPLGTLGGDLFRLPQVESFDTLIGRLQSTPDFLRFASEERLRDSEARLAATQRTPDITVSGGIRRLQASRDLALVASVSYPLFQGRQAESRIAEAAARRDFVGAERDAALTRARAQLYALHSELRNAEATVRMLDETLVPRMEEALEETGYAFERGRYSYLELVDAQREYLDVQRARVDAGTRVQLLAAEIERLTNAPLAAP